MFQPVSVILSGGEGEGLCTGLGTPFHVSVVIIIAGGS